MSIMTNSGLHMDRFEEFGAYDPAVEECVMLITRRSLIGSSSLLALAAMVGRLPAVAQLTRHNQLHGCWNQTVLRMWRAQLVVR